MNTVQVVSTMHTIISTKEMIACKNGLQATVAAVLPPLSPTCDCMYEWATVAAVLPPLSPMCDCMYEWATVAAVLPPLSLQCVIACMKGLQWQLSSPLSPTCDCMCEWATGYSGSSPPSLSNVSLMISYTTDWWHQTYVCIMKQEHHRNTKLQLIARVCIASLKC